MPPRSLRVDKGRLYVREADVLDGILTLLEYRHIPHVRVTNTGAIIYRDGKRIFGRRKHEQPGVADIVGAYKGHPFAIEVKNSEGGQVSLDQQRWLNAWREQGGGAFLIATSIDQVEHFLDNL